MHRILYVVTPEPDYSQDMVYAGLVRLLGQENVLDVPFKLNFRFSKKPYPRDMGIVHGNLGKRLLMMLRKFEPTAVVVSSCKPKCFQHYLKVLPSLPSNIPHLFMDGGDWADLGGDLARLGAPNLWSEVLAKRPFDLILKREKLKAVDYPAEVIGYPYGVQAERLPTTPLPARKYDVTFWAAESDPIRTQALAMLENRYDCRANGTVLGQTFRKYPRKGNAYLEELRAAKIVINLRGVGHDTLRYWEAPAVGTCMVSTRPPIEIHNNFIHNQHVAFIEDDLSDLLPTLDRLLEDNEHREQIAAQAQAFALRHHTHINRAQELLAWIEKLR